MELLLVLISILTWKVTISGKTLSIGNSKQKPLTLLNQNNGEDISYPIKNNLLQESSLHPLLC